jgi:hypothetical protein
VPPERQAFGKAQVLYCLACRAQISLQNYEVNENWLRRTQTRDNFHILKKLDARSDDPRP